MNVCDAVELDVVELTELVGVELEVELVDVESVVGVEVAVDVGVEGAVAKYMAPAATRMMTTIITADSILLIPCPRDSRCK